MVGLVDPVVLCLLLTLFIKKVGPLVQRDAIP